MPNKAISKQWITKKISISLMQHFLIKLKKKSYLGIIKKIIEHFSKRFMQLQLKSNGKLTKIQPSIQASNKALF
jgi:hypothetical protein